MERAPFGWNQPADIEDEDQSAPTRTPAQTERPARARGPAHTEPTAADDQSAGLDQFATDDQFAADRSAAPDRPAFGDLPLDFERYHASYNAAERWNVDDTPELGRDARIAYVLFVVALAVAGVWVIQRDVQGPVAQEEASQASTDPPSAGSATPPSAELGLGTPVQGVDDPTGTTATADLPPAPSVDPSLPSGSVEAGRTIEPPPLKGQTVDAGIQTRKPTPPPPVRRPLVIAPPPRPPYRPTFGEPTAPPPRAATMEPTPRPAPATPVPAPATRAVPSAETAPSPPRVAGADAVPLPRTAIEERVLAPPPTPPPAAVVTPPPAAAPTPAPSAAAPSAPAAAPTTASRTPAADVDSGAIRDVLGRYRSAFNTLDAKAAQQVWPSVNQRTLDRAFGQLEQQNVSFDTCTIYVKGVLAKANCRGTTRFVPRVGSRSAQVESRQWSFSLRKASSGGWLIQEVQAQ